MQTNEILETIKMIDEEYLDIRTITMGISLLDCMDPDIHVSCQKVEEKTYSYEAGGTVSGAQNPVLKITKKYNIS